MNITGESRCEWCGARATATIELEPAVWGMDKTPTGKRIKIMRRRALVAAVCSDHNSSLERNPARVRSFDA